MAVISVQLHILYYVSERVVMHHISLWQRTHGCHQTAHGPWGRYQSTKQGK